MRLGGQFEIGPTFLFGSGYAGLGAGHLKVDLDLIPALGPALAGPGARHEFPAVKARA
jgi:hypothetical protein